MAKVKSISVSEFKSKSLALFELIAAGKLSLVITKRGSPIAKVERIVEVDSQVPGQLKDTVIEEGDLISPLGISDWMAAK